MEENVLLVRESIYSSARCFSTNSLKNYSSCYVDPEPLKPHTASRFIALDKCPGVRPIGIGGVSQRIMSKVILSIVRSDIQDIVGHLHLLVGQTSGCVAAIHASDNLFDKDTTEGVLLIDTSYTVKTLVEIFHYYWWINELLASSHAWCATTTEGDQLITFNSKILPFRTHSDPILYSFHK